MKTYLLDVPVKVNVQLGCLICLFWSLSAQRHALNFPPIAASAVMAFAVWNLKWINLSDAVLLICQIFAGIAIYLLISVVFRMESCLYLFGLIKTMSNRKRVTSIGGCRKGL